MLLLPHFLNHLFQCKDLIHTSSTTPKRNLVLHQSVLQSLDALFRPKYQHIPSLQHSVNLFPYNFYSSPFLPYPYIRVLLPLSSNPLELYPCLLYTSDAADERSSVDLGGRRIIKKKKKKKFDAHL